MSLTLTCHCGARFEVEETFAGQELTCPQCQAPVKAPALAQGAVRTSYLAIASLVLSLVGAFTIVGTVVATLLGAIAIVRIQRHRHQLAGMGYAVAGILFGVVFTALLVFAVTTGEIFGIGEELRQRQLTGRVRDDPELEVVQKGAEGFSITRPSHDWAIAKDELKRDLKVQDVALVLVHKRRDITVDIETLGQLFESADRYADELLEGYRHQGRDDPEKILPKISDVKLRQKTTLANKNGAERVEMVVDMRVLGQPWTSLIRVVKSSEGHIFVISARAHVRVFKQSEDDVRRMMESFEPHAQ